MVIFVRNNLHTTIKQENCPWRKKKNRYKYTKKSPHTYHYREENTEIDSDYNKVNKNIVVFSFFRSVFNSNSSSQTRKISPYNSFNNLKNNLQFRMCTSI